jgi:hypothetical protein
MDPRFPMPKPREEFVKQLRARLMQEAPAALAPRRGTAWTMLLRPAMGVGLAAILLVAGAGTAAAGSVAGDATFGLKKAFEDLQVNLTFDDVQRVELLAKIADRRLQELQQVANNNTDNGNVTTASEEFTQAVLKFRAAVDAVQQAAPANADKAEKVQLVVETSRDKHAPIVDELQQKVSDGRAKDALDRARDEEDKNTSEDNNDGPHGGNVPEKTVRPTRTPTPARTAQPAGTPRATGTPRSQETIRPTSPRPTGSGRVAQTPKPGDQMDDQEHN